MKSILKINELQYTDVIYCKSVQFATVNQIRFATVNLNYFKNYLKNHLKCLTVYRSSKNYLDTQATLLHLHLVI